jgi:hypothetical protein
LKRAIIYLIYSFIYTIYPACITTEKFNDCSTVVEREGAAEQTSLSKKKNLLSISKLAILAANDNDDTNTFTTPSSFSSSSSVYAEAIVVTGKRQRVGEINDALDIIAAQAYLDHDTTSSITNGNDNSMGSDDILSSSVLITRLLAQAREASDTVTSTRKGKGAGAEAGADADLSDDQETYQSVTDSLILAMEVYLKSNLNAPTLGQPQPQISNNIEASLSVSSSSSSHTGVPGHHPISLFQIWRACISANKEKWLELQYMKQNLVDSDTLIPDELRGTHLYLLMRHLCLYQFYQRGEDITRAFMEAIDAEVDAEVEADATSYMNNKFNHQRGEGEGEGEGEGDDKTRARALVMLMQSVLELAAMDISDK